MEESTNKAEEALYVIHGNCRGSSILRFVCFGVLNFKTTEALNCLHRARDLGSVILQHTVLFCFLMSIYQR